MLIPESIRTPALYVLFVTLLVVIIFLLGERSTLKSQLQHATDQIVTSKTQYDRLATIHNQTLSELSDRNQLLVTKMSDIQTTNEKLLDTNKKTVQAILASKPPATCQDAIKYLIDNGRQ